MKDRSLDVNMLETNSSAGFIPFLYPLMSRNCMGILKEKLQDLPWTWLVTRNLTFFIVNCKLSILTCWRGTNSECSSIVV